MILGGTCSESVPTEEFALAKGLESEPEQHHEGPYNAVEDHEKDHKEKEVPPGVHDVYGAKCRADGVRCRRTKRKKCVVTRRSVPSYSFLLQQSKTNLNVFIELSLVSYDCLSTN